MTYRNLSRYFIGSQVARESVQSDLARASGAMFSLYAAFVDALRLPALVDWLNRKLTKGATS
jgi:hypothetical protein